MKMQNYDRLILLKRNTFSSIFYQITAIVCGFILPRVILGYYGSEVNGLTNSITQFLQVIVLMEGGVGAVVRAAFYEPIANRDTKKISEIYVAANAFFRRLVLAVFFYMIILIIVYPKFANERFDYLYIVSLIMAMGSGYFVQYYFGIVNSIFVNAAQKGYIINNLLSVCCILNTISGVILVYAGTSVQMLKLISSLIFLIKPVFLYFYVYLNYDIDRTARLRKDVIKQKWDGMAQHLSVFVFGSTDIIILTLFSTLENVSIYSVYFLVINGMKQLVNSVLLGFQSLLGDLWAKKEKEKLNFVFSRFVWLTHILCVFFFGCTSVLILSFVQVYTMGIHDAEYTQPLFSLVLTLSYGMESLRIPYLYMIFAAGRFKETKSVFIISTVVNIAVSMVLVKWTGLTGVAAGTGISLIYQNVWMVIYTDKNLIKGSAKFLVKIISADIVTVLLFMLHPFFIKNHVDSYVSWGLYALQISIFLIAVIVAVNILLQRDHMRYALGYIKKKCHFDREV